MQLRSPHRIPRSVHGNRQGDESHLLLFFIFGADFFCKSDTVEQQTKAELFQKP